MNYRTAKIIAGCCIGYGILVDIIVLALAYSPIALFGPFPYRYDNVSGQLVGLSPWPLLGYGAGNVVVGVWLLATRRPKK